MSKYFYHIPPAFTYISKKSFRLVALVLGFGLAIISSNSFGQTAVSTPGGKEPVAESQQAIGHRSVTGTNWKKGGLYEKFTPEQEIIEKRDANSKHFLNKDGTVTAVISQAAVHFKKDESSAWEDIRTDIRPVASDIKTPYTLAVTENKYQLFFGGLVDQGYMVRFPKGDVELGTKGEIRLLSAANKVVKTISRKQSAAQVTDNTIKFDNTYASAYDKIKVNSVGVDHDIVLKQKPEFLSSTDAPTVAFREFIKLPAGWKIVSKDQYACATCGQTIENAKNLYILNAEGKVQGELMEPVISEQNERQIEHNGTKGKTIEHKHEKTKGAFSIEYADGGAYLETLVPTAWLNDADRQYPVVVDPTLTCYPSSTPGWTGYSESSSFCGCGTNNCGDYIIWEGTEAYIGWSYFNVSSVPGNATVSGVDVYYYVFSYDCPFFYIRWMSGYNNACPTMWNYEQSGAQFANVSTCSTVTGYNNTVLGGAAAADLQSQVGSGMWGVSFVDYDNSTTYYAEAYGYYYGTGLSPYIVVTYSIPSPPTGCNIATETSPDVITPTGCTNGQVKLGAGAYYNLPILANTYYDFTFTAGPCSNGLCATPQNGNGTTFSGNINDWFSGTTTTLRVSSSSTGCFSGTSSVLTYRYSTPSITLTNAQPTPICAGSTLDLVSSSAYATTLTWTGPNSYTGVGNNPTITNIQPVNAGVYTFTANNAGCLVTANTPSVVVNSTATANAGPNQTICSSTASVAITGASATNDSSVSWATSGTGTFTNGTTLTPTYTPSAADVAAGVVTLTLTSHSHAPCANATSTKTLTIVGAPTANAGANQTACSNAGVVSITGASATNSAGVVWNTSGSGTFTNGNTLTPSYTPSAADLTAGSVTLTLTVSGTSPCGSATSTKTLTFIAAPTAVAGANQSTCSNAGAVSITGASDTHAVSVNWTTSGTGTFAGGTTLTPTYTPSGADITAGSVTLTLTVTGNAPCAVATASKTLTIIAAPTVNAGANQTTCSAAGAVSITGASSTNTSAVGWTTSGTGTFANGSTLTPSYTPSAGDITAGSVTLTLTGAGNSPCASATSTKVLTIVAAPAPNAGGNQSTCSTSGAVSITGASAPNSTGVSWTSSGSGTFTGANTLTPAYTPSGADITAGTVTLTLTATGNAPCGSATATKTLTITPAPTVSAGGNQITCSNAGAVSITGATDAHVAGVTWTTSGSGAFANGNTLTPSYTPSPGDITAGTVTLTLTGTGNSPCGPVTSTKTLTIVAAPAPDAGGNQSTCSTGGPVSITGASAPNSVTINWTSNGTGTFTGAATLTPTYTPSAADIAAGNVTLTLTATGNAPCSFVSSSKTLTITPAATASAGANQTACSNAGSVSITGASASNYGSISWTTSGTGTFSNEFTLTPGYSPSAGDIAAGTVTLTLTATGNTPCSNAVSSKTLTIVGAPAPNAGGNQSTCSNAGAVSITGASAPNAASVSWTSSGTGTFTAANTLTPTYTPSAADITAGSVTLTLTATGNSPCASATATKTLTIVPPPTVNAGPALSTCANSGTVDISGATAANYSSLAWSSSGTGTFTNSTTLVTGYNPSAADTIGGSVTLTLTATGNGSCATAHSTVVLTIHPLPTGSITGTATICSGSNATLTFNLFTASPFNVIYDAGVNVVTANGITNGHTITVSPPVGTTTYQLTSITDNNGCVRTGTFQGGATVTVTPTPVVSYSSTPVLCNGTSTGTITITASSGTPGYTYSIDSGLVYQSSDVFSNLTAGTDYVLEVKDSHGCTAFYASNPVSIIQPAVLTQRDSVTGSSCSSVSNGSIIVTASGGTAPYTYSLNGGPSQNGNSFTGLSAGAYVIGVEDNNGCKDTTHVTISNSSVISDTILSQTNVSCYGGSNGAVTVQLNGGVGPDSYSDDGSIFQSSPTFTGLTAGTYLITLKDSRGCTGFLSTTITQPAVLDVVIDSIHNISCSGSAQGAIYISATGGTLPYTYSWSDNATTQNLTNVGAGSYNVTVLDAKGCNANIGATITQPAALFANVATVHNLTCYNDSSGYIYVTANGGVPPYSYSWSTGATTQDVSGLHIGTYHMTVTDANGCQVTITQGITQPTQLTSTISAINVTCNGAADGSVTFSVSGGTSPYTYLWSDGATTQSLTNLAGGEYSVLVNDANGCSLTNAISVSEPAAIVLGISSTNVTCYGDSNGTVTTTVTGGTGTIIYAWSNGASTANLTNVPAGTYSVIITDAHSCTASASTTVNQPTALVLNGTVSNVLCFGGSDGSVAITVNGGVFPYSYSWSNGATTQNINDVIAGTYMVTATDANRCIILDTFNVTTPTAITSSVAGTNVTCHGEANGTATLTVSGGTSPYSFTWSTFQSSQNLTGLSGGTYYVIITDANGCTKRDSVTITEPAAIVLGITSTNVSCYGDTNGTVTTTVTGGTGTIVYAWSNSATTANLINVGAGTYSVIITDSNLCTASASATVTQPTALVLNGTVVNVLCAGSSNGSVDITVNGGVFPYSYSWSNSATTQNINGLSGGTYIITATDANHCIITDTFIVNQPAPITSSITPTNVTCYGVADGAATLTVNGGALPYSFFWSNFQATQNLSGVVANTYYVVITDANGCTHRDSTTITQPPAIVIGLTAVNVSCFGGDNGSVASTVTGGTGNITYLWNNGATTLTISNLIAGTYTVVDSDANGCSASDSIVVAQPSKLVLNGTVDNAACFGGDNGSIQITVTGGVAPYTYSWSNTATTQNLNNLLGGVTYVVTATDANLCTITASFDVTTPPALVDTITGTDVVCYGINTGSATVSVGGGTQPYSYLWSNFQGSATINNLSGGLYYVIVTDANGCTKKDSILINEPGQLVITSVDTQITCNNADNGVINLIVTGGTPTYNYLWSPTLSNSPYQPGLDGGLYSVTVTDAHSCTISTQINMVNPPAIAINFVITNPKCYGDSNGSVNMIISGGVPAYSIMWSVAGDTTPQVPNAAVGTYYVTITDASGCVRSDSATVATPEPMYTSGVIKNVSCAGKSDGQINITVYGGTLPYNYNWSYQNTSTQNLYSIPGGDYYVTVTDANGCKVASLYIVHEPDTLAVTLTGTNVSCFGGHNGTAIAVAAGGTTPYRYAWVGTVSSDSSVSNLAAGLYGLQLTDSNLCYVFDSILITQPTQLAVTGFSNNAICFNSATGSVITSASGGTPGYHFIWSNGGADSAINTVSAGIYTVTVSDSNSCSITASFTVDQDPKLTVELSTYDPVCNQGNTGAITALAQGGETPYQFAWSSGPGDTLVSVNQLVAGVYVVTVTDHDGCTITAGATLTQPAMISVSPSISGVKCFNSASGVVIANTTGGTAPFDYSLNGFSQKSDTFNHVLPGFYELTAVDVNGCEGTDTFSIGAALSLNVSLTVTDQVILTGMQTQLSATATSNSPIVGYIWSPIAIDSVDVFSYSDCPDSSDCSAPYVMPPFTTNFMVTAINADSCEASDTITVYVHDQVGLEFIPTAFTPNGDGLNDRFTFAILGAKTIEVSIYDRWGARVYYDAAQPNGISNSYGWDGTKNGKDAPEDTYVYQFVVTYYNNTTKTIAGSVTLMR